MSYTDRIGEMGRKPVYIVEMDLDFCTRTYGVSPCTAAIGVTGTAKCFQTRKTCQDAANYSGGAVGVANTFNPASGTVLTDGDLTAACRNEAGVRALIGKSSGKWYYECTVGTLASSLGIGIGSAAALNKFPGYDGNGAGYTSEFGYRRFSGATTAYGSPFVAGDIVSVLYDADVGTLAFWLNGTTQGDIATVFAGMEMFPMVGEVNAIALNNYVTANFGATSFVYAMPAGYQAWRTASGRKTYRFSNVLLPPSSDVDLIAIPAVTSVGLAPTVIDPIRSGPWQTAT